MTEQNLHKIDLNKVVNNFSELELALGHKDKLIRGVNYIGDMVKVTLGAKGKNVLFRNKMTGKATITKDGVTIAKQLYSEDPVENMAIEIVREASEKTVKSSGDGTTTTVILAQYLVNKGFELMQNGVSYYELARKMDEARRDVIEYVTKHSIPIEGNFDKLLNVAIVSASDEEIGTFIFDIIKEIGIYGSIEVKKSNNTKDRIEKTCGIKFSKGFYAPHFVNDLVKMQWRAGDVRIVLLNDVIRSMSDVMSFYNSNPDKSTPILFIVNEIESTVLQSLINNKMMNAGGFNVMFVEHDGFGDRRTEIMNDIAAMTSSRVMTLKEMMSIESKAELNSCMGYAEEIIVDGETTSIIGGLINEDVVGEIVDITNRKLADETLIDEMDDNDRLYYKRRLSTLTGGVAVIYVGAATEVEMNEKKDRIDDAVEAVKSAIERGVSIGGGYTFLKCYEEIGAPFGTTKEYRQVMTCLLQPFSQLCNNAGVNPEPIQKQIITDNVGYDVISNNVVNLEEYKVYDPTGVLIDALSNAISVAKSILSIERVSL